MKSDNLVKTLNKYPYYKIIKNFEKTDDVLKDKFLTFAKQLGPLRVQNSKNDKIVEIQPNLKKIKLLAKKKKNIKSVLRYHQTNLGGSIHSDGPQLDSPPKYVIMVCEDNSVRGGNSILVNTKRIYNYLNKYKRDNLMILKKKFLFERRGFNYKNDNLFSKPIFLKIKGKFVFRYLRDYIEKGFKIKKKKITKVQKESLDLLDDLLQSNKFCKRLKLNRGDLLVLNNHILAHGRTSFKINSKKKANRKLYRIWLN